MNDRFYVIVYRITRKESGWLSVACLNTQHAQVKKNVILKYIVLIFLYKHYTSSIILVY